MSITPRNGASATTRPSRDHFLMSSGRSVSSAASTWSIALLPECRSSNGVPMSSNSDAAAAADTPRITPSSSVAHMSACASGSTNPTRMILRESVCGVKAFCGCFSSSGTVSSVRREMYRFATPVAMRTTFHSPERLMITGYSEDSNAASLMQRKSDSSPRSLLSTSTGRFSCITTLRCRARMPWRRTDLIELVDCRSAPLLATML
mmetsp:Transcript_41301/g.127600  ORF Transcript_41301/g.127600 Transcript_41301/m.127600 type:complete len:206 (-) Transcript_41301:974-1591(-)